jgi:hypothetical protein
VFAGTVQPFTGTICMGSGTKDTCDTLKGSWCALEGDAAEKWHQEKSISASVTSASSVFLVGVLAVIGRAAYSKTNCNRPRVHAQEYDRMAVVEFTRPSPEPRGLGEE